MQEDEWGAQGVRLAWEAVFVDELFNLMSAIKIFIDGYREKEEQGGQMTEQAAEE